MMNTAVREQMNAFLNTKVEERLEDRQVYNVKLLSYTMQQREDGRFALLMNFTVEDHDVTLFRYQMLDKFNSMVAQPIKEYLGHNGFDVEEADNAQILDLMRENYLPVYYKEDEKDPTRHNIYFNRRQVIKMTDNDLTYLEELYEGEYVYISDGLEHYI